ncbi:Aste57867_3997 [Aphanomyces stellatus]|uniref:Aste57867_3997 protein n=1 Tax=Aphanomyces stellatus TaxID=120398 RepID=A0A485KD58_9STRA|nr:hypothetical protein As57867_003986 [Aphanomyces stellatus]VFT81132.1 Aste57867_3997 [Aphanomyces stellatus]
MNGPEKPSPAKIWLIDDKDLSFQGTAIRSHETDSGIKTATSNSLPDYCVMLDHDRTTDSAILTDESKPDDDFGALRPGGALNLLSWEAFALLSQYAGVGLVYGVFAALQYPLFQNYLHMEGYQTASYNVLTALGWSSKIFFGILSDCFPIFGYQRRPYMVLGWAICGTCCALMAVTPFPKPYYGKAELVRVPKANMTADDLAFINVDAPTSGGFFIVMSMVASLGYVMADVAADAMVVQYAQREPAAIRGRVQTAIYLTRDSFSMIPMLLVGFCMNDFKYGGTFSWSMSPNLVYAILVVPCVLAAYSAFSLMVEDKVEHVPLRDYLGSAWMLLQQRVVWQIAAFKFINTILAGYTSTLTDPVSSLWVHVQPIINTTFQIVYQLIRVVTMFTIGRYALSWDWRATIAACTVILVVMDTAINYAAIWDVQRNQYLQNVVASLEALPSAAVFLFGGYLLVEIPDVGNEALVYALMTSCQNLATPLSTVLAKTVDSFFDARLADIQRDDTTVRWQVTYSFTAAALFKLASLAFLGLMPRQKAYVQVLKRTGSLSPVAAAIVLVVFFGGYFYNLTTNILSVFPSTSCLRVAGGKGC